MVAAAHPHPKIPKDPATPLGTGISYQYSKNAVKLWPGRRLSF